jgi:hypothetical protein
MTLVPPFHLPEPIDDGHEPLGALVRRGVFADFYELSARPARIAKRANERREKRYPFGLTVSYPLKLYATLKYGIPDLMQYEYRQWSALPAELRPYVLQHVTLARGPRGETLLCADQVVDWDGTPSRSLSETGPIANRPFWSQIDCFIDVLRTRRLYLCGVLRGGSHILVQRTSSDAARPVIIDVMKIGRKLYPFQIQLAWEAALRNKFERGVARFRSRFETRL